MSDATTKPGQDQAHRLLCCTDGSDDSLAGLASSLAALRPGDWDIVVLTVVSGLDETLVTGTGFAGPAMPEADFHAESEAIAAAGHATASQAARSLGLAQARIDVASGAPGPAICRRAADEGSTAILMGTRGRGGVARALLGSVSDHVVRNAPCPVMVSSPTSRGRGAGPVVVCVDGSDQSRHAALMSLPLIPRDDVLIATVIEAPHVPVPYDGSTIDHALVDPTHLRRAAEERSRQAMDLVEDMAQQLGVPARFEVLEGPAGPSLCELAERESARAIVIGSRGRGGLARAMLGSVSDYVIRNAACPTVVTSAAAPTPG